MPFPAHILSRCFALLDDHSASAEAPTSRLYTDCVQVLLCMQADDLPALFAQMALGQQQGQFALGLFDYELGTHQRTGLPASTCKPLAQMLMFRQCQHLSAAAVQEWLEAQDKPQDDTERDQPVDMHPLDKQPAGIANLSASVDQAEFTVALEQIHRYIEAGDTYQINYTYRLHFDAFGSLPSLYLRLRARQPVPYGALIGLPDGNAVLSLSPELFIRHSQGLVTARPMKGTAAANAMAGGDAAKALASDPKNRAENLMIVDLLRNDLGRIAKPGSVTVPQLFEVNRYASVLQMTSTVQAQLREDVTLAELFDAVYPCGSITGAPKRRSMEIIDELETEPRGIYTGAIGWFDAALAPGHGQDRIGDFCLSVPIRTLALQAPNAAGIRPGTMGVGAGIVFDSQSADEYAECQLKASFLTGLGNDFELFETMHATQADGCRYRERHLQRLSASAAYFGFRCDLAQLGNLLQQHCAALPSEVPHRIRLSLKQDGAAFVQSAPLLPLAQRVRLLLASDTTAADDLFLRHKSSVRSRYDAGWRKAEAQGAFDSIFFNSDGALTEGGRSNIFLKLDGHWYTPPLAAGLLPGVMRAVLLQDPAWNARERYLTRDDLFKAEQIVACNALRGVMDAVVDVKTAG
ncbi:MAG: chorismate-binding protein [Pseudomonadota bacterium]